MCIRDRYDDDDLCGVGWRSEKEATGSSIVQRINLYPNPATDKIIVEYQLSNPAGSYLTIYNVYGQLAKEYAFPDTSGKLVVPVSDLTSGIYWYAVTSAESIVTSGKIVINH